MQCIINSMGSSQAKIYAAKRCALELLVRRLLLMQNDRWNRMLLHSISFSYSSTSKTNFKWLGDMLLHHYSFFICCPSNSRHFDVSICLSWRKHQLIKWEGTKISYCLKYHISLPKPMHYSSFDLSSSSSSTTRPAFWKVDGQKNIKSF